MTDFYVRCIVCGGSMHGENFEEGVGFYCPDCEISISIKKQNSFVEFMKKFDPEFFDNTMGE